MHRDQKKVRSTRLRQKRPRVEALPFNAELPSPTRPRPPAARGGRLRRAPCGWSRHRGAAVVRRRRDVFGRPVRGVPAIPLLVRLACGPSRRKARARRGTRNCSRDRLPLSRPRMRYGPAGILSGSPAARPWNCGHRRRELHPHSKAELGAGHRRCAERGQGDGLDRHPDVRGVRRRCTGWHGLVQLACIRTHRVGHICAAFGHTGIGAANVSRRDEPGSAPDGFVAQRTRQCVRTACRDSRLLPGRGQLTCNQRGPVGAPSPRPDS